MSDSGRRDGGATPGGTAANAVELAHLLLDAYRGTIDDEGETLTEALHAVDGYLPRILPQYSLVVERDGTLIAMAFAV